MDHDPMLQALQLLYQPGDVFEVRALRASRPGIRHPHIESGYFDYAHLEGVGEAIEEIDAAYGIYVTMNPVKPELLARATNRLKPARRGESTSDAEILRRRWWLIDIDPKRPRGISATDGEKERAFETAMQVYSGLESMGFPAPLVVDSGNGYYLMYRVDLPADDDGLLHRCLQALQPVATSEVSIDLSVANPARICRLPGTWNCKGDPTPDRPHRMAELLDHPRPPQVVPVARLEDLAATVAPATETPPGAAVAPTAASSDTSRPGDDFNARGDIRPLLEAHGWQPLHEAENNEHWRRPGKTDGQSATFDGQTFYVFSSNAQPFAANTGYSPFAVYAHLEHSGDFAAASHALAEAGYGDPPAPTEYPGVDLSGLLASVGIDSPAEAAAPAPDIAASQREATLARFGPRTLAERFQEDFSLNPPVVHGLLREGETMNLVASSKTGKTWLALNLAVSVASGLDWLGLRLEQGGVLYIDNELHANTSTYRFHTIGTAMGLDARLYGPQLTTVSLRGKLATLAELGSLFRAYPPGSFKLVVIDAFYRALPSGTDENDNAGMAQVYNLIDQYAAQMGCAFVLVHHTSKGNQAAKSVTDVGAGAGSQSRAVDTHVVLRPHEQPGLVVLEAAVRSFPPLQPRVLSWDWPLFAPTEEADPSALMGLAPPPKPKRSGPTLGAFVDRCVAINDPCSERSVTYEARQHFGLSERAAKDTLALATERGLVARLRLGSNMRYVKVRAGISGDKGLLTAALVKQMAGADNLEIAKEVDVSERYVRQIRQQLQQPPPEAVEASGNLDLDDLLAQLTVGDATSEAGAPS